MCRGSLRRIPSTSWRCRKLWLTYLEDRQERTGGRPGRLAASILQWSWSDSWKARATRVDLLELKSLLADLSLIKKNNQSQSLPGAAEGCQLLCMLVDGSEQMCCCLHLFSDRQLLWCVWLLALWPVCQGDVKKTVYCTAVSTEERRSWARSQNSSGRLLGSWTLQGKLHIQTVTLHISIGLLHSTFSLSAAQNVNELWSGDGWMDGEGTEGHFKDYNHNMKNIYLKWQI